MKYFKLLMILLPLVLVTSCSSLKDGKKGCCKNKQAKQCHLKSKKKSSCKGGQCKLDKTCCSKKKK